MKHLLWIIITIGLISCNRSNHLDKYINELPDSTLINNVISSVVQIDSFQNDYKISKKIIIPTIYKLPIWNNNPTPPPPPVPFSISYDRLYAHFDVENDKLKKNEDSIFIKLQIDTARRFFVSSKLLLKYNSGSNKFYQFDLPIFSFDKQKVFIQYWKHCGTLCGTCYQILLRRNGSKWIKVRGWTCGVS
jgi:hypothetical protein